MIQERPDFKTLDPSDILERLNTHEFQLSEKRDIYGPNYGRTRALKAKVVSSSEEESDNSSDDPEDIRKELAMLVKNNHQIHGNPTHHKVFGIVETLAPKSHKVWHS